MLISLKGNPWIYHLCLLAKCTSEYFLSIQINLISLSSNIQQAEKPYAILNRCLGKKDHHLITWETNSKIVELATFPLTYRHIIYHTEKHTKGTVIFRLHFLFFPEKVKFCSTILGSSYWKATPGRFTETRSII